MTDRVIWDRLAVALSKDYSMAVALELDRGVLDIESMLRDSTRAASFGCSAGSIYTRLPSPTTSDTSDAE